MKKIILIWIKVLNGIERFEFGLREEVCNIIILGYISYLKIFKYGYEFEETCKLNRKMLGKVLVIKDKWSWYVWFFFVKKHKRYDENEKERKIATCWIKFILLFTSKINLGGSYECIFDIAWNLLVFSASFFN